MTASHLDVADVWQTIFHAEMKEHSDKYPDVPPSEWQAAAKPRKSHKQNGDLTKAAEEKPNGEDGAWWVEHGLGFVQAYIEWRKTGSWQIWVTPDGEPAIELHLKVLFGDQAVQVYIDRVFVTPEGELVIVDLKAGANMPSDEGLQFGFYASAFEVAYGIRPQWCCYYDARKGCITPPTKVDHLTPELLGKAVKEFNRGVDMRLFVPNVGFGCKTCNVRKGCAIVGGEDAALYDSLLREESA